MGTLDSKVNNDWEKDVKCDFGECYERGTHFICYYLDYQECPIYLEKYKNKEGTNCTQK